jgi:hypothetical protein
VNASFALTQTQNKNMKTCLKTILAALSVALFLTVTLSSCENSRKAGGGWHNMGINSKDNRPMPDENMPVRR